MGFARKLASGNGLVICTIIFIIFNITNIPFLFHLILDYSPIKLWLYIAHCLVIFIAFIPVMYGLREILHSLADYHGIDSHINTYVWANLGFFIITGFVILGYWFELISGWMAILVGILVSSVIYLLIPILAIIMGAKLKECQHDLYGLRDPIRLSMLWYGVLCLSFFLSELAIIATWFNDILLLMLFINFKKQLEQKDSETVVGRFSKSKIWGFFAIAVFVSVANYASLFLMPTDRVSIFDWFFSSDEEESYQEDEYIDYELPVLSKTVLKEKLSIKSVYSEPDVSFINGDQIWLGYYDYLRISSDRGQSFKTSPSPLENGISFIQFDESSQKGVVANNRRELAVTSDGGANWEKIDLVEIVGRYENGDLPSIRSFVFDEPIEKGYFVADCDLWSNTQGFNQWEKITIESDGESECVDEAFLGDGGELAWAKVTKFGFDHTTHFWRTLDGGKSWQEVCSYYSQFLSKTNKKRHCDTVESDLPELSDAKILRLLKKVEVQAEAAEKNQPLDESIMKIAQSFDFFKNDKKFSRIWYLKDGLKYTENLGTTWHQITTWFNLGTDILWANDNGFALGNADCKLWKTQNFGKLWEVIEHETNDDCVIFYLQFESDDKVFLSNSRELITIDKNNFSKQHLINLKGEDNYIGAIESTLDNGLIIAQKFERPAQFSIDLGETWYDTQPDFGFKYIKCLRSCWGIKNNKLYKVNINDKQLVASELANLPLSQAVEAFYEPQNDVSIVFTADEKVGWIVTNAGDVLSTNDGGLTWKSEVDLPEGYYHSYLREELDELWVVNEGDKLWRIDMLGTARQEIQLGGLGRISSLCFNSGKSFHFIAGDDGSAVSFDRGETWQDPQIGYNTCYLESDYLWMGGRVYSTSNKFDNQ